MKKILAIVFMMILSLSSYAQRWSKTDYKGDELKGIKPYSSYCYDIPNMGGFFVWNWEDPNFRLYANKGMFRESIYNMGWGNFRADKVYVGIYRISTRELIEKYIIYMNVEDNSGYERIYINSGNATRGQLKKVKRILKYLLTEDICVRFVCERYNSTDFDLIVPNYRAE